ncbi:anhydro-N-acetylmuramic acid kinase [Sabulilitoribacter arenilitoris]|uniref:Anhydro-N-acetylmuramic acid kinase n=1 Tax=Wocania arenilitoris TaxID=2044858 RepID=A0AAE3JKZ0_9FLAO|nr:anhydro-N-acetylmuramic acid kinase [Wocania arenilitoris]MCF7567699.1 anhydro-N-acetylmuramic acid kinase [Wocania arenilitoris]
MTKSKFKVIGVMSGTSLDGIDLVYATFKFNQQWHFEIIYAETIEYTEKWPSVLKDLVLYNFDELLRIDEKYTIYLSEVIKNFIQKHNIKTIDAVCSHGHTALHQPKKKLTYQIGNLPDIAKLLNYKVVCDFRKQDVEFGGQGAPLVPIGDKLLFSEYDYCINLGGFANVSYEFKNERIAFDICPINIVLNHYVKQLGFDYDDKGKIASTGTINKSLLNQLNALRFYKETSPKSLGLEWVKSNILPLIDAFELETKDVLRTFVEHVVIQIANIIGSDSKKRVLITGGGAYNNFFIERLKQHSRNKIVIPSKAIVEFKEALIFAFLGVLKLRNEINCLQSVTGANKDHSSGKIFLP